MTELTVEHLNLLVKLLSDEKVKKLIDKCYPNGGELHTIDGEGKLTGWNKTHGNLYLNIELEGLTPYINDFKQVVKFEGYTPYFGYAPSSREECDEFIAGLKEEISGTEEDRKDEKEYLEDLKKQFEYLGL